MKERERACEEEIRAEGKKEEKKKKKGKQQADVLANVIFIIAE